MTVKASPEALAVIREIPSVRQLIDVLQECYELLDDYSDVNDGDDGQPRPNKAMSMMNQIEFALRGVGESV